MDSYNEANISTEQDKTEQTIRFQKQDGYKGREKHTQAQKEEGKETPDSGWQGMIWFILQAVRLISKKKKEKFNRKERVRRRDDFQRVLREGRRTHCGQYSLIVVENSFDYVRLGLSIRKSIGNAVKRNYEKRLCREFFRREIIGLKMGFDVLIIIKHRTESFPESYRKLQTLFQRSLK